LKWLHILSSVLLVGTGFGSAFYLYFTHRTRNVPAIAEVARLVVRADFWFTTPAIIIQPLTGYAMMSMTGYTFSQTWLAWTLAFYVLARHLLVASCLAAIANAGYGRRCR